jgi:hypothetical protein
MVLNRHVQDQLVMCCEKGVERGCKKGGGVRGGPCEPLHKS